MYYRVFSLSIVLLFAAQLRAQTFNFNENCRNAYTHIIALRLQEGAKLLAAEERTNPDNLIAIYLENYIDFLQVYTNDTRSLYEQLKKNKEVRLTLLAAGDMASPYYLFSQAEVSIQWAALSIKFGEYLNAIFEIRKAYKLLEENERKFPDFKANKKTLGVLYALLGSVPDKYKWGVNLLGMEGNVEKGITYLRELCEYVPPPDKQEVSHTFMYREETITIYAFLLFHLQNDAETAWQALHTAGFPQKNNLMNVYTCAHIGIYGKHNDEALKILANRPSGSAFPVFPHLEYLTGLAKLNKLESDADSYFKKYIAAYKGENHIKSAFQKIAWCYWLKGDTVNYFHFLSKIKSNGGAVLDADKQALREAESKKMPNTYLLRARLLFDGGYYQQAVTEMNKISETHFISDEDKTEYFYRTARIYDEWGKTDSALLLYSRAIEKGKNLPRYFAASSAFETGSIFEKRGDINKASEYYHLCLSFQEHEYKNGLDQKAKAGLNRINR